MIGNLRSRYGGSLAGQMFKGAVGPVASAIPLFALPLLGAALLPSGQFAMWSILASISTLALSIDFGGPAYLASRLDPRHRSRPFLVAAAMSCFGTMVVAALSVCAWIPFSKTAAGSSFEFGEGVKAIVAISFGSALRSVIQLQAQVALFDKRFGLRNVILLGHAIAAFGAALIVLLTKPTAWALPISWLVAGLVGLILGLLAFKKPNLCSTETWTIETSQLASSSTYVWARTVANVFRGSLMQADRWVVGAVGGPAVLAAYEVAWRVAVLPRFLAENLTYIVGIDAARVRASSPEQIVTRLLYSMRFTLRILIVVSLGSTIFYATLTTISSISSAWYSFALLVLAHGAVAMSAPISFVGNGIGIPKIDLPYLSLSVSMSIAAAIGAYMSGHVYVFVVGMSASLVIGNVWFGRYGLSTIRAALPRTGVR